MKRAACLLVATLIFRPISAQTAHKADTSSPRLTKAQFLETARACGDFVPPDTLLALAKTESALRTLALSVNYPETAARKAGYDGRLILTRQASSEQEAIQWLNWFIAHNYTTSVGLMQINIQTAQRYGIAPLELLDPCVNIRLGSVIISEYYQMERRRGVKRKQAFLNAISAYNSGDVQKGYANGYVGSVVQNGHAQ